MKNKHITALLPILFLFTGHCDVFGQSVRSDATFSQMCCAFLEEFHLSAETGYNFLIPSATEKNTYYIPYSTEVQNIFNSHYTVENPWGDAAYGYFHHHQWNVAVAAESRIVKWRLALERDYLDYEYYGETFDADYFRTSLSLQFFILNKRLQILIGPSLELGWITKYVYTNDDATIHNPDIGQTTGINLLFPLTLSYLITNRSRIYIQVAGGLHLRDDHELPSHNHWGYGPGPEAALITTCPFSIGAGYSFLLR